MTAVRDHAAYALAAACTALSTSRAAESGTCSITSPVAGLNTGRNAVPSDGRHHWPPIRLRIIAGCRPLLRGRTLDESRSGFVALPRSVRFLAGARPES